MDAAFLRAEVLATRSLPEEAFLAALDLLLDFLAEALVLLLVASALAACAGTMTARLNTDARAQVSQFFFQFACATVRPFRLAESVNKKARKINDLRAFYQVT